MRGVPTGWMVRPLGYYVERLDSGTSVNCEDRPAQNGEPGMLKLSCVADGRFNAAENKTILPKERERARMCARRGAILISRSNTVELVGASASVPEDFPTLFVPDTLWQTAFRDGVEFDGAWLGYVLSSPSIRRRLRELAAGTSGSMKKLTKPSVLGLGVLSPPKPEQHQIAKVLACCGRVLEATESLIEARVCRRRGLMQQLLTGRTRFKEFKGERWCRVGLGELVQEVDRYVTFDDEHTYRLASIRRRSEGLFFREALQGKDIKTKVMKTIRAGDFLLSKMQVVHGAWGLVTPEFDGMFVSDSYISLVPRSGSALKIEFLNYLSRMRFMRHLAYVCSHGVHIEKMTFNLDDFLGEKITIPPTLEEQTRIVGVLSACDREIELLQKQLSSLKEQKRGLTEKLLTGEIRVKV